MRYFSSLVSNIRFYVLVFLTVLIIVLIILDQTREQLVIKNSHNDLSFKGSELVHEDNDFLTDKWISKHSIHLFGGVFVLGFLVFALIKQLRNKKL